PPPNPLDRPWVHPTELSSFVAAPEAPARETRPREWAIGIGSAVAAVIATVLVLVAFGALGGRHRSPLPPPVVTNPGDVIDYSVAERVGAVVAPSIVTVRTGGDTTAPVGSGVVIKSDRVITAAHLLNGATKVEVSTSAGQTPTANVVGILTHPAGAGPDGLAIPVALVRDVEDQLDSSGSNGKVTHGWIGVLCDPADADRTGGGAQVRVVVPGSPAAKAGLQQG